jgi:hypothetical protein
MARLVRGRHGLARHGRRGQAGVCVARSVKSRQARSVEARWVSDWGGVAGMTGRGSGWHGAVLRGRHGKVRFVLAWNRTAGLVKARQA